MDSWRVIYFLAFLPSVTRSPAAADGPTGLNFSMWVDLEANSMIFGKLRSKVKVQVQISTEICPFWAIFGHRGYMWDYSEPGRVRWGIIGSMPTNLGNFGKTGKS